MKKVILFVLTLCCFNTCFAKHIKGGYIEYKYLGAGTTSNTSDYQVTVYLFVSCTTSGPTSEVYLGVFDAATNASIQSQVILNTNENTVSKTTFSSCISDPPSICYQIYTYVTTIELSNSTNGYILAVQSALRVEGIINIQNSSADGITTYATIPGTIKGVDYHTTSSPNFIFDDTAVICYNSPFTYQFNATDPNGDSLSYAFGDGLNVNNASGNTNTTAPASPPYASLTYATGYSGTMPLGNAVTINPVSGIISGTAPSATGVYVVAVYVSQWNKGVLIATTKKELQIDVDNCTLTAASLNPVYINCSSYTFNFENASAASNVETYSWNFGVPGSTRDTSTQPTPTYTYADTGTYTLKLVVTSTGGCSDSASSTVKVYPGFIPGFTVSGSCYQSPFQFTDSSTAKYGAINSWSWNFGAPSSTTDTSSLQNPSWLYTAPGTATVTLAITSTEGCSGTATKTVTVNDKPAIYLPFTDTLICSNDTLPLIVQSTGSTFSWTPAYNISSTSSYNPKVYPNNTTVYTVTVTQKGCVDSATVTVNVLQYITVSLIPDTAICRTDSITLNPVSYALSYLWSQSGTTNTLSSTNTKYPKAAPTVATTYYVTANLGHCQDSAKETVYVSPYPSATVSNDTAICFGKSVRLYGSTTAAYYTWSPLNTLYQSSTLTPVAGPQVTTTYYFTIKDTFYCTKSVTDSIIVTVIPRVTVNAGNDTMVVINQPLQLLATSNNSTVNYLWSPATYLSNQNIYNPVATITSAMPDSIIYKVTAATPAGCYGTAYVTVKIFNTTPDIFVPSAFTPNGDGRNDMLKPVLVGIAEFNYFRVFNRWGQCVYQTARKGEGWDGNVNGRAQPSGTYVFVTQGKDYLGNIIFKKGSVILIR